METPVLNDFHWDTDYFLDLVSKTSFVLYRESNQINYLSQFIWLKCPPAILSLKKNNEESWRLEDSLQRSATSQGRLRLKACGWAGNGPFCARQESRAVALATTESPAWLGTSRPGQKELCNRKDSKPSWGKGKKKRASSRKRNIRETPFHPKMDSHFICC